MHGTPLGLWVLAGLGSGMFVLSGCARSQTVTPMAPGPHRPGGQAWVWNFDRSLPDTLPEGWSIRQTNPTKALAAWRVVKEATAPSKPNVLALTRTENYNGTFNLAIAEGSCFYDLDLTVKVKAVSGEEDQGGGPIWRCKDENNYYICRFNPLEGNYRVYKVVDGKRKQLDSVKVATESGRWYGVRVTMVGDLITCYLEGKKMLEAHDGTFKEPGTVGLWTKADAVTSFDELTVGTAQEGW